MHYKYFLDHIALVEHLSQYHQIIFVKILAKTRNNFN